MLPLPIGPIVNDELKVGYGTDELEAKAPLETAELREPIAGEPETLEAGTLPVPVGPTNEVEFKVGYGADEDPNEDLAPPEAVDEGAELLLKIPPEMFELVRRIPVPVDVAEELDAV